MNDLFGVGLALLGALALALQALCIRLGTNRGTSTEALLVVLGINIVVFVPLAAVTEYPTVQLSTASLGAFLLAGLSGTLFGRVFYYAGIERIGASRAEPIKATQPLHATLIAVLVLNETITGGAVVGIALIVLGVAYISLISRNDTPPDTESSSVLGISLPFLAAFFLGLEPTFAKIGFAGGGSPFLGLAIKTVVASVALGLYVLVRHGVSSFDFARENLRWYVAAGLLNTTFLLSYYTALEVTKVSIVVPLLQTSPIIVTLFSFLLLPRLERITLRLILGTLVVVGGAVVVTVIG